MTGIFDLSGQVVIVTGGYGHLGRAASAGLAAHGAQVAVMGRSRERFDAVFPEPNRVDFVEGDILDTVSVAAAFTQVAERWGRIDGIINNATTVSGREPLAITDDEWAQTMDGVVGSAYRCIREVVPFLESAGGGSIVNVSSMYGVTVPDFRVYDDFPEFTNPPHYGAGKAGLIHMTRYFARLLGPSNIRVNTVSPGPFPNERIQGKTGFIENLEAKTALGRIGKPDDLIGAFVYLCSPASAFVTGHNLVVDGGWTAGV